MAASAAAAVGDSVNAAVVALTTPNKTSVASGPRRRSSSRRSRGRWSARVGGTATKSGSLGSRSRLPVSERPKPAVAAAAAIMRPISTASSPGRLIGCCRAGARSIAPFGVGDDSAQPCGRRHVGGVGVHGDHQPRKGAVQECPAHARRCANGRQHVGGDCRSVLAAEATHLDPAARTVGAATPYRWAACRFDRHARRRAGQRRNVRRGTGQRPAHAHRHTAAQQRRASGGARDDSARSNRHSGACRGDPQRCPQAETGQTTPRDHSLHTTQHKLRITRLGSRTTGCLQVNVRLTTAGSATRFRRYRPCSVDM